MFHNFVIMYNIIVMPICILLLVGAFIHINKELNVGKRRNRDGK